MRTYVIKRILISIPILFILSVLVFIATRQISTPEAAFRTNPRIRAEDIQRYREQLGLDKSEPEQYLTWLGNFVRGDFGKSLITNREVWPQLESALANTLVLASVAVVVSLMLGIAIGVTSAVRQNTFIDYFSTGAAFFGISMPPFWFGLILQLLFGVYLVNWLGLDEPLFYTAGMFKPGSSGFDLLDRLRHIALPAMVLAVQLVAVYSRYMRASMLEVLHSDYLRTARAKGLPERRVLLRHGVRTAMIPLTTQAAIDIGLLVGGLVVTEQIFQWPGMGVLFLEALERGDYVILLPWLMITATAVIAVNLIADLLYGVLDPRIRYG